MVKRIRNMWGNLSFKLLYVVCSTFLPINIIAVTVSGLVIWKSTEQTFDSYQRDLTISMNRLEMDLIRIDEQMDEFVLEFLTELTLSDGSDLMISHEMVKNLGKIFGTTEMKGFFYLYDCRDEQLFTKFSEGTYNILKVEEIKQQLLENGLLGKTNTPRQIIRLKDRFFYVTSYQYTNYQIGYLVDIEESFCMILEGLLTNRRIIYFTDGNSIVSLSTNEIVEEQSLQWEDIFHYNFLRKSLEWSSKVLGCSVGMQINIGISLESIPILYWILMVAALLCIFLIFGLWRLIQMRVVKPLNTLKDAMMQLEQENLKYRIENTDQKESNDFIYIYDAFNQMAEKIKLSHEKDIMMYQVQLDNLLLQVNPHMLLNSLNMIYSLAQTRDYECIQEFSMYLVDYFRYALKETDIFVTLEKEMNFVKNYTGIQKIRFPGAFTYVYSMEPGIEQALVPPLLIENFVENAMKYALIPGKTIEVLINIRSEDDRLLVSICDTGRGIKEDILECIQKGEVYIDKMEHKHIGIWNCRRRMEVFYGDNASMNIISSRGEGTQVWLELPLLTNIKNIYSDRGCGGSKDEAFNRG